MVELLPGHGHMPAVSNEAAPEPAPGPPADRARTPCVRWARMATNPAQRDAWHFTVLFSNTARAHELGRVLDWVVVYFHSKDEPEGQSTVVTETRGQLAGKRVVRGREAECRGYYHATERETYVS